MTIIHNVLLEFLSDNTQVLDYTDVPLYDKNYIKLQNKLAGQYMSLWTRVSCQDDICEMIHCHYGFSKNTLIEEKANENSTVMCPVFMHRHVYYVQELTYTILILWLRGKSSKTSTNRITADNLTIKQDKSSQSPIVNTVVNSWKKGSSLLIIKRKLTSIQDE